MKSYDIIIAGAGHAGCEAAFAAARLGNKVLLCSVSLDNIALLACNPSIGGTAKGHLVREIDALGGEMGLSADSTMLQLKMLNSGKGAAVQSLRAQTDKHLYHRTVKEKLEAIENIELFNCEIAEILVKDNKVYGVKNNYGEEILAKAVIVACGVYLRSSIITGSYRKDIGPAGFPAANLLSSSLTQLGFELRRFKTGTPARADGKSIDYSVMSRQDGEDGLYMFSFLNNGGYANKKPCYLTYTNLQTHKIIQDNLHLAPMYSGQIKGTGARYCPSIEDKVVRFPDKERHQIFIEPEGEHTNEVYLQGISTSMPAEVQEKIYRSIAGLENVKITRYAYAIEYDCIDSTELTSGLQSKRIPGLFFAGQINGSSGYEEAGAQGLVAGINAAQFAFGKEPFILGRSESYIGVLVDDLVIKGTNEPYRMMTARAENRLYLRQDNADIRLTEKGRELGLVMDDRWNAFLKRKQDIAEITQALEKRVAPKDYAEFFTKCGEPEGNSALKYSEMLKRPAIKLRALCEHFGILQNYSFSELDFVETEIKYSGYMEKHIIEEQRNKKLETTNLPLWIDYLSMEGLRLEARQKLTKFRPSNIGEASRISGVSPADIAVLIMYIKSGKLNLSKPKE